MYVCVLGMDEMFFLNCEKGFVLSQRSQLHLGVVLRNSKSTTVSHSCFKMLGGGMF